MEILDGFFARNKGFIGLRLWERAWHCWYLYFKLLILWTVKEIEFCSFYSANMACFIKDVLGSNGSWKGPGYRESVQLLRAPGILNLTFQTWSSAVLKSNQIPQTKFFHAFKNMFMCYQISRICILVSVVQRLVTQISVNWHNPRVW